MSLVEVEKIAKKVYRRAVRVSKDPSLFCMCAICSYSIFKLCREQGIRVKFALGVGHVFITYQGKIVDVTAGQFGEKCGLIVKDIRTVKNKQSYWKIERRLDSLKSVEEELKTWPEEQTPEGYDIW